MISAIYIYSNQSENLYDNLTKNSEKKLYFAGVRFSYNTLSLKVYRCQHFVTEPSLSASTFGRQLFLDADVL